MVLDASLLNTQQYKVRIEGKVEQSREKSSASSTPRLALDYGRQHYFLLHGLFNAKAIFLDEQQWYYLTMSSGKIRSFTP